jgi:exosortase
MSVPLRLAGGLGPAPRPVQKCIAADPLGNAALAAIVAILGTCLLWAYWSTLQGMADRWAHDPHYSHGFLVPVFAVVVLWSRRQLLRSRGLAPNWWGLALLAGAAVCRLIAAYTGLLYLDGPSLLPALAGLCLLVGGWPVLRWAWPAIAFLAFMLPLPYTVEMALAHPLRRLATAMSTYALQTMGWSAVSEGNVIVMEEVRLGVIDACSGLGMLMTFFALSTAVALVVNRPLVDRLVIVVSAVPIAVIANVARITATGVAHQLLGAQAAHDLFHVLAGWLMMPLGLGLLWLELSLLSTLLVNVESGRPVPLTFTVLPQALAYTSSPVDPITLSPASPSGVAEGAERGPKPGGRPATPRMP